MVNQNLEIEDNLQIEKKKNLNHHLTDQILQSMERVTKTRFSIITNWNV